MIIDDKIRDANLQKGPSIKYLHSNLGFSDVPVPLVRF